MKTKLAVSIGLSITACIGIGYPAWTGSTADGSTVALHRHQSPLKIRAQAALIKPYFLPTLEDFARSWFVTGAVEGEVTGGKTHVSDDQGSVGTTLTVEVTRGWGIVDSTITVTEYGGVVPLREVRSTFEGKEWQKPLTEDDLDRSVEYRMEGFAPTQVGDRVVMFLAKKDDGSFGLAAKLVPSGTSYVWAEGEAPNDIWAKEYSAAEIDSLLAAK